LAANNAGFPKPDDHMILPETLSKEPLAPAVRHGDNKWADLVRWSLYAMVNAEELDITSKNVDEMRKSTNPIIRRFLGVEGNIHEGIGLNKDWAYNIIKQVGNYGENYERYIGNGEKAIKISRKGTLNALWINGGLMYSPPMR
jgi:general L-amino acid transport system substrate-binding protein